MSSTVFFAAWLQERVRSARKFRLRNSVRAVHEYKVNHGPRWSYAKVSIAAQPADEFAFSSAGAWNSEAERAEYEPFVLDAIALSLLDWPSGVVVGIRVHLENALVDEVNSNGNAFHRVTLQAMNEILDRDAHFAYNAEPIA